MKKKIIIKSKKTVWVLLLFFGNTTQAQNIPIGPYVHPAFTSQSVDYSALEHINQIQVSMEFINMVWDDAYILIEYKPVVSNFSTKYGGSYNYLDFAGGSDAIGGSFTAKWIFPSGQEMIYKGSFVHNKIGEVHRHIATNNFSISSKELFGNAKQQIESSGGNYTKAELVKRGQGFAPFLTELTFHNVKLSRQKYVDENYGKLKKRLDLVAKGNALHGAGNCKEAAIVFKEAINIIPSHATLFKALALDNADIQSKANDCEQRNKTEIADNQKEEEYNTLISQAKEAEQNSDLRKAQQLYGQAHELNPNAETQSAIDRTAQKIAQQTTDNQQASVQNDANQTTELDFWGNPVAKKSTDRQAETVNYDGTEMQNNEHSRSQLALRERNAHAERMRQADRAAERKRVDDHNDAIFAQAERGIEQTNRDIAEMDRAISQLDYSSGKGLLESSSNLARVATATGNIGQAKGALIGMGVGAVMAIGEGAAKRKAAREAREERDRLEKERIAALKIALRNARTSVFRYFKPGELPMSSTRSVGNNLYYFVYAADNGRMEEDTFNVHISNVFAIGRYPDGTWPMKTKIEQELDALTPLQEVIHGPYASFEEAQSSWQQFAGYAQKARMEIVEIEHKGFNVQPEGNNLTSTGSVLDFFGNPVNSKKETQTKQSQKKSTAPQKAQSTELDFWGNPVKK